MSVNSLPIRLAGLFLGLVLGFQAYALEYLSPQELGRQLRKLARDHRAIMQVERVAQSPGNHRVWRVSLGSRKNPDLHLRPAMLAVAGLEGNDLPGTACLVSWIQELVAGYNQDTNTQHLLDTTAIYVFPCLNPDAAADFFARPKTETTVNRRPVDDDHDGLTDEDGPEDLDGDGIIAWMRVQDPAGEFILDPVEPRLLLKTDKAKGEIGAWRLLTEGIDNDHDEAWNEDGPGGVNLNRNFPFHYQPFEPDSGRHPVSEPETRALADFVVAHPNLAAVFSFGANDNLAQLPKSEPGGKRPPTALQEGDLPIYRELGKQWRESLGLGKELTSISANGAFGDYIYFDRGRLSLTARAWSPAIQLALAKTKTKSESEKPKGNPESNAGAAVSDAGDKSAKSEEKTGRPDAETRKKAESDARNEEDRAFLKWIDTNAPGLFLPWKEIKHPDFPGKKVEVGGFAPYAKTTPPADVYAALAAPQRRFLTALAQKLPRVGIRKIETKSLGNSVYDILLQVENTGYLPTSLAQGQTTAEINPTRVVLHLPDQAILAGAQRTMLDPLEGSGGMKEVRWTVHVKNVDKITVEIISALGGSLQTELKLHPEH